MKEKERIYNFVLLRKNVTLTDGFLHVDTFC